MNAPQQGRPILLFIVGPPAVGKMTVGCEVERRTGLRLFHNHQTIELVLPYFDFGSPPFFRLVGEFRRRIFEEVADSELPGIIFTYVWAFDQPSDEAELERYAVPFREHGGRVLFVELEATQDERLRRNEMPDRLAAKPSKRDIEASRARLLEADERYQLNSGGAFDGRDDYLRIDNTERSAATVAEHVITNFDLPRLDLSKPSSS